MRVLAVPPGHLQVKRLAQGHRDAGNERDPLREEGEREGEWPLQRSVCVCVCVFVCVYVCVL